MLVFGEGLASEFDVLDTTTCVWKTFPTMFEPKTVWKVNQEVFGLGEDDEMGKIVKLNISNIPKKPFVSEIHNVFLTKLLDP
jgi:hypothetical protein